MQLFLNGNRNIQLRSRSFAGLDSVLGLYLHDCSLTSLQVNVIQPLNNSLKNLWLNGNELEQLDPRFQTIFLSLTHLRLGSNPLHCNCEVVWLKEFYDKHRKLFEGGAGVALPSCNSPQRLKDKFFSTLSLFDFRCMPPVFNNIDAMFDDVTAKLRCTASGDPAPTLFWIQPSGESRRYSPSNDEDVRRNEGLLRITQTPDKAQAGPVALGERAQDLSGMYICLALNEAGNVTLTLNVTWPNSHNHHNHLPHRTLDKYPTPDLSNIFRLTTPLPTSSSTLKVTSTSPNLPEFYIRPTHTSLPRRKYDKDTSLPRHKYDKDSNRLKPVKPIDILIDTDDILFETDNANEVIKPAPPSDVIHQNNDARLNYTTLHMVHVGSGVTSRRQFTLSELVGAVIGTHICTLLLCLVLFPLYLKKRWKHNLFSGSLAKSDKDSFYAKGICPEDYIYTRTPTLPTKL